MTERPPRPRLAQRLALRSVASLVALSLAATPVVQAQQPQEQQQQPRRAPKFKGSPVTLNFVNAEIEGVARAMSAILNQQFTVDPRVKGTITLYSEQPLSPNEAYLNFLAALRGLGFTVVEVGGLYKVVPEADAKLQAGVVSIGPNNVRGDQVLTQVYKLNYENANNLVPVLRPLISPNNTINANPGNNSLVITDYADNLQRIAKIIAAMDTASSGDVEVIPLKHAVASDIAQLVQRLTDSAGGQAGAPGMPGAPGASSSATVMVDARSNSLLVRAPNPAKLTAIRALVTKLDTPSAGANGMGNIWVVYLKNADAVKLAQVLRAAYAATQQSANGGIGGGGASPIGNASNNNAQQNFGGSGATGQSIQATSPVTPSAGPSTGGFVQADPASNSLIITAPEPMYRQLRAMIDQLDSRRAQVYIESMIVEVSGDDAADFGFQWQGMSGRKGDNSVVAGGTSFDSTSGANIIDLSVAAAGGRTTAAGALGGLPNGFNIGVLKNLGDGLYGLSAIARALQSRADTNIVSTPNIVTLDNEEAKIIVADNVPFVTGSYTNTGTSTSSPFQTVDRKDVGITLRIKPQIGENGNIRMTIYQESSSLKADTAPGTTNLGPSTNKKSIESTVVVEDGQVIVLGGLIQDTVTVNKSKVPLLGDIPLVGALFRAESREKKRTNQMVFLRPIVMRDGEATNKLSLDRYDLIRNEQQKVQLPSNLLLPIGSVPVIPPLQTPAPSTTAAPLAPARERPMSTPAAPASAGAPASN